MRALSGKIKFSLGNIYHKVNIFISSQLGEMLDSNMPIREQMGIKVPSRVILLND